MARERIRISETFPTTRATLYQAWLDGKKHAAMTGGAASDAGKVGTTFTAWDGYITGSTLELRPHERIVQSWRTSEFEEDDADSHLTILLEEEGEGATRITIIHTDLPSGSGLKYEQGWVEHYFEPMAKYFGVEG